jgi:hypothetical protein
MIIDKSDDLTNISISNVKRDIAALRQADAEISAINNASIKITSRLILVSPATIRQIVGEKCSQQSELERGDPVMYAFLEDGSAVFYPVPHLDKPPKLYIEWSEPDKPELPLPPETIYKPEV